MAIRSPDPQPAKIDALVEKLKLLRKPVVASNPYVLPPAAPRLNMSQLSCMHQLRCYCLRDILVEQLR